MKIDRIIEAIGELPDGYFAAVSVYTKDEDGFIENEGQLDLTTDDLKLLADRAEAADRYEAMLRRAESIRSDAWDLMQVAPDRWLMLVGSQPFGEICDDPLEAFERAALDAFSAGKDS
jgi:hypothetical protein